MDLTDDYEHEHDYEYDYEVKVQVVWVGSALSSAVATQIGCTFTS